MASLVGSPSTGLRVAFVFVAVILALAIVVLYMAFGSDAGQPGPGGTPRASPSGSARAVDVIQMKAGTHTGTFVAATSGNDSQPIYLCAGGYAINATKRLSNVVACDHTQNGAGNGLSNVVCT
jgi:hypothetical protein